MTVTALDFSCCSGNKHIEQTNHYEKDLGNYKHC